MTLMLIRKTDPNDPNSHLFWELWRYEGAVISNKIFKKAAAPATRKPGVGREFSLEGVLKSYTERPNINLTH